MKNIKKFEQFVNENKGLASKVPTYSESDKYIADVLDEFDVSYRIGKDSVGNEGVFIIKLNNTDKLEIYSLHPKLEHSAFNITYDNNGKIKSFKTHDLKKSMDDIKQDFYKINYYHKESLSELSDDNSKFLDEIKDLIPDTFSLSKDKFSYDFNHTTKKYINPYHYISFNIDKIKKGEDYDIIITDLYRLYGILSNNYKISFSLEIHHPYEFHNDIDFKKCIEVINIVKNNNIEKSGKRKIGESLRSRIVELSIIFEGVVVVK